MSVPFSAVRLGLLAGLSLLATAAVAAGDDAIDAFEIEPLFEIVRPEGAGETLLTLQPANGPALEFAFEADEAVLLTSDLLARYRAQDGLYNWRASFRPLLDEAALAALAASRENPGLPITVVSIPAQTGSLRVIDGGFLTVLTPTDPIEGDGDGGSRDQVIADDLIVDGSTCIGTDCVNNENFGADTLRLKENNLRIHFQDTSVGTFPTTDWRLVANDSNNGGPNFFGVQDAETGRFPLYLEANAPDNAIYLDSSGSVGFGTNLPNAAISLHAVSGNTPSLRLDQDGSDGFTAYAWDVAGNETNFFIRDVNNSSSLPFRIEPGAATSSIHIEADEDIGFGTANPAAALHAQRNLTYTGEWLRIDVPDDMNPATEDRRMVLDNAGNLFVGGAITQLSSRHSKGNLISVAGDQVLARLAELPLWTWNYLSSSASDRHIGPVAEDFYRAFGFGTSERSLSPSDVAGVALAASQALHREIEERDQRIEELEARLARLEAALLRQENATDSER